MTLRRRVRSFLIDARELVFPDVSLSPEAEAAETNAGILWDNVFAPLQPMIDDADILEIGCGDARVIAACLFGALPGGKARSAVGLEREARWNGVGGAVALPLDERPERLELHADLGHLTALDPGSFDLILCRSVEAIFPLSEIEQGLRRLFDLARPGGEVLVSVCCADFRAPAPEGAGYGFLTPTSWIMLMMRAGFEIGDLRRIWRDQADAPAAARALPSASDEERMTGELRCRLIRPWDGSDLETVWSG